MRIYLIFKSFNNFSKDDDIVHWSSTRYKAHLEGKDEMLHMRSVDIHFRNGFVNNIAQTYGTELLDKL